MILYENAEKGEILKVKIDINQTRVFFSPCDCLFKLDSTSSPVLCLYNLYIYFYYYHWLHLTQVNYYSTLNMSSKASHDKFSKLFHVITKCHCTIILNGLVTNIFICLTILHAILNTSYFWSTLQLTSANFFCFKFDLVSSIYSLYICLEVISLEWSVAQLPSKFSYNLPIYHFFCSTWMP